MILRWQFPFWKCFDCWVRSIRTLSPDNLCGVLSVNRTVVTAAVHGDNWLACWKGSSGALPHEKRSAAKVRWATAVQCVSRPSEHGLRTTWINLLRKLAL